MKSEVELAKESVIRWANAVAESSSARGFHISLDRLKDHILRLEQAEFKAEKKAAFPDTKACGSCGGDHRPELTCQERVKS